MSTETKDIIGRLKDVEIYLNNEILDFLRNCMPEAVTAVTAHDGYLIILEGNKLSLVWPPELGILAVPKIWNMCTTSEKIIIVKALPALKVDMGKEINKLLDYHDINGKSKI